MEYNVGDILKVDGRRYKILGKLQYKNVDDNCRWMEYRLKPVDGGGEFWLSVDEVYDEYALYCAAKQVSLDGYKKVDEGTQEVIGAWGRADAQAGDRAAFTEYEDASEENIISEEVWEDGREVSIGYYLDWDEITVETNPKNVQAAKNTAGTNYRKAGSAKPPKKKNKLAVVILCAAVIFLGLAIIGAVSGNKHSISDYLKSNTTAYVYVTSITGSGKEKADVYRALTSMDLAARDILRAIEGDVTDVQQNTEGDDKSITILTEDEYCLVYTSEDNEVLVQVSSRKFAYTSDTTPYRCHARTYRYYRGFYFTRGFTRDRSSFSSYNSAYSDYDGETINYSSTDPYSSYSSSIRQSSVGSRTSSGGGLSSGK